MKNKKTVFIALVYIGVIGIMVLSTLFIVDGIKKFVSSSENLNEFDYTIEDVFDEDDSTPVIKVEDNSIIKPYLSENVSIGKYYYDYESSIEKQEESIIYYENTYMQNTGVNYVDNEKFDIVSVLDGEIVSIEDSEIYGKIVTIKHNDNLTTIYSNLEGVLVNLGYKVSQGEIIASSRNNTIDNDNSNLLHFEVYYKGKSIDPENLYTLKVSDIE